MKKFIIALTALLTLTISANAMSYDQARQQALFLTDKMAYELNLTDDQYEAAYEINLDYLMGINNYNDLYGSYWQQRNLDLSYILFDWQYNYFCNATYFYRPLYWNGGYWHFAIYSRYPHRDYYFFGRPNFYAEYRGGHSWRTNGGRSWYNGRSWGSREGERSFGMRDSYNRGDFGRGNKGMANRNNNNNNNNNTRTFGNNQNRNYESNRSTSANSRGQYGNPTNRQSSTRTTVTTPSSSTQNSSRFGGMRSNFNSSSSQAPRQTFTPNRSTSSQSYSAPRSTQSTSSARSSAPAKSSSSGTSTSGSIRFGGHR